MIAPAVSLTDETLTRYAETLRLADAVEAAEADPKALINEIRYFDPTTQLWVEFKMFPAEGWCSPVELSYNGDLEFVAQAEDWFWQARFIDWLHDPEHHAYLVYKARQLGITLLACAYAVWLMVKRPGAVTVAFSYEEGEAWKLTQAAYAMYESLPPVFTDHLELVTPRRGAIPTEWFRIRHPDGRVSEFQALPAGGNHGHGARGSFCIQDELSRQQYGRRIYEAVVPAVLSRGGKWLGVSTANGVSDPETGEGNFFHHLVSTRREKKIRYVFMPWNAEPTRDMQWYEDVAMKLPTVERNRQYPLTEEDGFILSGDLYFDADSLNWYRHDGVIKPLYAGQWVKAPRQTARPTADFIRLRDGVIEVYAEPVAGAKYGISCDTSTGRAKDYTVADVIDLATGEIVAHLRAKLSMPRAGWQLYWLGHRYNTAKILVERGGGYGEALIMLLRDGNREFPPYPNLYRNETVANSKRKVSDEFGFPMTKDSRPIVLELLRDLIYTRTFPFLTHDHIRELQTFVYKPEGEGASPRAQDGTNDDCVMSLAMLGLLWKKYGDQPTPRAHRRRKTKSRGYQRGPVKAGG